MARPPIDIKPSDFYFSLIRPGGGKEDIQFEAHISAVSDSSSPSWQENFDMGRADPKMFYQSVSRNISISFNIIALSKEEHDINKIKMERLGLATYPIYKNGLGYNGFHIFYNIGNLMTGYGVISSLDYSWDNEIPWINKEPIYTSVQMSIKVLADRMGIRPRNTGKYF